MNTYEKVKIRADDLRYSISKLESESGLSNGTISGWRTSKPYAESLCKVAKVLQCSVEELLGDKE